MAYVRPDAWAHWKQGVITIRTRADLELLLTCRASIAPYESVYFGGLRWDDDADAVVAVSDFVADAARQVVAAGLLPAPVGVFADLGARVQTMEFGGRPSPQCRYGEGTVTSLSWSRAEQVWRVNVEFDKSTGGWQGFPVYSTSTFPWMVCVVGGGGRAFSEMSPEAIERLYHRRRARYAPPAQPPATAVATTTSEEDDFDEEELHDDREAPLAHFGGGPLWVFETAELDALLACREPFNEEVSLSSPSELVAGDTEGQWGKRAIDSLVAAGLVTAPTEELPPLGTIVETIGLANKVEPRWRAVSGRISSLSYEPENGRWGVTVDFEESVPLRRGGRIRTWSGTLSMVHIVGSFSRPFSDMSAEEIREHFERLRPLAPNDGGVALL